MRSLNKVFLIGNLGQDPELRFTPSGTPVTTLSVATSHTWKNKTGESESRTEWHRVRVWNKRAEICKEFLKKGSKVFVEGTLRYDSWTDSSGQKRYSTEVRAENILFLDRKEEVGEVEESGLADMDADSFGPAIQLDDDNVPRR